MGHLPPVDEIVRQKSWRWPVAHRESLLAVSGGLTGPGAGSDSSSDESNHITKRKSQNGAGAPPHRHTVTFGANHNDEQSHHEQSHGSETSSVVDLTQFFQSPGQSPRISTMEGSLDHHNSDPERCGEAGVDAASKADGAVSSGVRNRNEFLCLCTRRSCLLPHGISTTGVENECRAHTGPNIGEPR